MLGFNLSFKSAQTKPNIAGPRSNQISAAGHIVPCGQKIHFSDEYYLTFILMITSDQ